MGACCEGVLEREAFVGKRPPLFILRRRVYFEVPLYSVSSTEIFQYEVSSFTNVSISDSYCFSNIVQE